MKINSITSAFILLLVCFPQYVFAHFGMIIPSSNVATQDDKTIKLNMSFSHPFELSGMELEKPVAFGVMVDNKKTNLLDTIKQTTILDKTGWKTDYSVKRPGVYQFYFEPTPYWEPAEDLFIIHYTKAFVAAFGADSGWDTPIGLPVEIIPHTRPFGNYAGNSFTGQVLVNGKPATNTEVEVELYNQGGSYKAPSDYHITQVVKTDQNGLFTFTVNAPGWWGFSALTEADYTLPLKGGEEKGVELGGVLWIFFDTI